MIQRTCLEIITLLVWQFLYFLEIVNRLRIVFLFQKYFSQMRLDFVVKRERFRDQIELFLGSVKKLFFLKLTPLKKWQ